MTPRELLLLYLKQHRTDPHAPEKWHAAIVALFDERESDAEALRAENDAWRKQCDTLTHQVICCGVAASHPDATLTTRGAYAGKWNSRQAEEVRQLRAERDAFSRQLDKIIEG
jgi:cytochrome P450